MPELPEVETIVRQLAPHILHKKIVKVEIFRPAQWKMTPPEKAINILTNNSMQRIHRRAKFIHIELENDFRLVLHLRMSGKLIWQNNWDLVDQYTRTIFYFEDHSSLQFNDTRALGTLDIFAPDCRPDCLEKLGIEPLG
ncbi:DNA-formamidopyrimidine glycosylase, partial [candidate division KSB1 bacterium]|nr:DNA-formamidopyrimidine glycosylase [candidate division KSB1 bacterium]